MPDCTRYYCPLLFDIVDICQEKLMSKIRGNRYGIYRNPQDILSVFEEIAEIYNLSTSLKHGYYVKDKSHLQRINIGSVWSIFEFLNAVRRNFDLSIYLSRCGVDCLNIKNHYLGFFPQHSLAIKVFLNLDSYQAHLQGALRFKEFNFNHIKSPDILCNDLKPYPHIKENLISGNSFNLLPMNLEKNTIQELTTFHLAEPSYAEVRVSERESTQIVEYLLALGMSPILVDRIREFLALKSWRVIEGEIHGDINRGNLIQGKDAVYLTDWEFYSRGPVAQDLVKIYSEASDDIRQMILKIYQEKIDSSPLGKGTLDFASSLLIFSFKSLLSLKNESRDQLSMVFGAQDEVSSRIATHEERIKGSIESLLLAANLNDK